MIFKQADGSYHVTEYVIIDESDGITSHDEEDDVEVNSQRRLKLEFRLPKNFFEPVAINVDFPDVLTQDKAVEGFVNQLEIPVELNARKGKVTLEEKLRSDGRGMGLITLIKSIITGEKKDEYKK